MSSIGDTVWFDSDGDGVQDSGEPGIPNVTVNLHSAGPDDIDGNGDDINLSTVTDSNGNYTFSTLYSDEYTITVDDSTLPPDLAQTYDLDGLGTPHTATGDLEINEDRIDFDFGYQGTASLGDKVWKDENYNGIQNSEDLGVPNVTVTAVWAGADGDISTESDNAIFTTTTDSNGNYLFDNIPAGNYIVTVKKSDDSSFTFENQGSDDELDSDADLATGQSEQITLAAGEHRRDVDFGIRDEFTGAIGNAVWYDKGCDGERDNNSGIEDIRVKLIWAGPDGKFDDGDDDDVVWRTNTNHNGHYIFEDLPDGKYRVIVKEEDVTGWVQTYDPSDSKNMNNQLTLELDKGEEYMRADFGYADPAEECGLDEDGVLAETGGWFFFGIN